MFGIPKYVMYIALAIVAIVIIMFLYRWHLCNQVSQKYNIPHGMIDERVKRATDTEYVGGLFSVVSDISLLQRTLKEE